MFGLDQIYCGLSGRKQCKSHSLLLHYQILNFYHRWEGKLMELLHNSKYSHMVYIVKII